MWLRDSTQERHFRVFICEKITTSPQHVTTFAVNGGVVVWLRSSRASQLTSGHCAHAGSHAETEQTHYS